ncbi:MAG: TetR family transcriptional regulator [Caulobacteraceae bacterium]|nr:TetR family transcriptional regulator [Caulobacteraceae bacterium]
MNHQPSRPLAAADAPPMTRRALAKQRTRERLLDAARRLFAERGYEAATVRDIANAADLSTGAVFASFSDKADLFNEVIIADYQTLSEQMAGLDVQGLPAREALLILLGSAYESHLEQLGLIQAAISFSWQRDSDAERRNRQGMKLILSLLAQVLRKGVERGELSETLDVRLTTEMMWDSYLSNYRRAIFDDWNAEALSQRLAAQLDILLAGFRAAA